jgi:feruloyl esterase
MANRARGLKARYLQTIGACVLSAGAVSALPATAAAQAFADAESARVDYSVADLAPAKACADLANMEIEGAVELAATEIPANGDTPAMCSVTGVLAPEIAFEVALPENWNGRFYMTGNGGLAGDALDSPGRVAQRNQAAALGFAFAHTNTGHYASEEPGGSFVLSDPQKAIDYAWRAVHETAATAKTIAADYYGQPVSYSYWNSCSNGGRQGMLEVQRFPADFDGVVANAPWVNQTGFALGAIWNQQALTRAPLTAGKVETVANAVMARCDAIDGLQDGLIDDPRMCDFDPTRDVPACTSNEAADSCLTPDEALAVADIHRGPVSNGENVMSGFLPGSEPFWMGLVVPAQTGAPTADFGLADNIIKYLALTPPQPDWDYMTFDFDTDLSLLDAWGEQANALDPDLTEFRDRGGKLIMTYGWADQILQPLMGVDYYEDVMAEMGPGTPDFARLFMAPGMSHCAGGAGPDQHDPMTAIIDWVEAGAAPDMMLASKLEDGEVVRTRPLCPYPQVARYDGDGSIDEAENFSCVAP